MSNAITPLDPAAVASLIAHDAVTSGSQIPVSMPSELELAQAISEVQIQTQTLGASLLRITLIDPGWKIQRSGMVTPDSEGLLPAVDVEFPKGSGMWWRSVMVEGGGDVTQANLSWVFQDRIIAYLNDKWGAKTVAKGTTTRAQFVAQLVAEVGKGDGLQPIKFVCPAENILQDVQTTVVETTSTGTRTVKVTTAKQAAALAAKVNKSTPSSGVTRESWAVDFLNALGMPLTKPNIQAIVGWEVTEGGAGPQFNVPNNTANFNPINTTQTAPGSTTVNSDGVQSYTSWGQGLDATVQTITQNAFGYPAILAALKAGDNALAVAGAIFGSKWGTGPNVADVIKSIIVDSNIGGTPIAATAAATSGASDVLQLTRGTPANPDESSWECIQRLAADVNWVAFSNGNYLYYFDGPTLAIQPPSVYLSLDETAQKWTATNPDDGDTATDLVLHISYTIDNTMFQYTSTHKRRGRIQRQSRIRTPQTPSQIKMNMVCGILDYRAGDVFVFRNAGAMTGRWIVEDATRNVIGDVHTQFTLGPPPIPIFEPAGTGTPASFTPPAPPTPAPSPAPRPQITHPGTVAGAVEAAQLALAEKSQYSYTEKIPERENKGYLFGPAPRTMDCSSFVTLCYRAAGLPDPNHQNYHPIGNTTSLISHSTSIANGAEQPGDLCFFGSSVTNTAHVTIYIGNGQAISMGRQGDPSLVTANQGPAPFLGFYRPIPGGGPPPTGAVGPTGSVAAPTGSTGALGAGTPSLWGQQ